MEKIKKIDAYLIERLNTFYLWAFDWTGIYVGSVIFMLSIPPISYFIMRERMWIAGLMFIMTMIIVAPRYMMQGAGKYEIFNHMAMQFEGWLTLRCSFLALNLGCLIMPEPHWFGYVVDTCSILVWYVFCIKIRAREPKEFFARKMIEQGSA